MKPTARQRAAMRELAAIYYSAGRNTMLVRIASAHPGDIVESRSVTFLSADRTGADCGSDERRIDVGSATTG